MSIIKITRATKVLKMGMREETCKGKEALEWSTLRSSNVSPCEVDVQGPNHLEWASSGVVADGMAFIFTFSCPSSLLCL